GVYGFGGHGFRVNLHHVPPIYHGPRRPPGWLPAHRLIPVHGGQAPPANAPHVSAGHTMHGAEVRPLPMIGGAAPRNRGFALGAALNRDYPVNRTTHQPIAGTVANHAMPVGSFANGVRATWRPATVPGQTGQGFVQRSQLPRPAYVPPSSPLPRSPVFPATGLRPQPSPSLGVPRYAPPPPAPRYSPPPMPRYTPPPPTPRYTPAPPMPRYTPAPMAPRYAPAPPPAARPSPRR
ncbi:MAG TPA: hypothetical protein VH250_05500, partial [Granulicella sp.]|nr:hypothetical protein [Granulicella sp.]